MPPTPPTSKERGAGTLPAWSCSPSTLVTSSASSHLTLAHHSPSHSLTHTSTHHPSIPSNGSSHHPTKRAAYHHTQTPSLRAQSSFLSPSLHLSLSLSRVSARPWLTTQLQPTPPALHLSSRTRIMLMAANRIQEYHIFGY
ncbi:hypothetical protein LY76DRAFT_297610 [Colletotrichum caudatum]|nr:hypothetical protein LY76DRAFT_297610 [Colletotrichum caudatum]